MKLTPQQRQEIKDKFYKEYTASQNGDWVGSEDGDLYTGEEIADYFLKVLDQELAKREDLRKYAYNEGFKDGANSMNFGVPDSASQE